MSSIVIALLLVAIATALNAFTLWLQVRSNRRLNPTRCCYTAIDGRRCYLREGHRGDHLV